MKELVIHVRHLPDYKNAQVLVRPVALRIYDGVKCFTTIGEEFETKRLPNDFYLKEFMKLDADNVEDLLDFQLEYGLIETSLVRDEEPSKHLFLTAAEINKEKLGLVNEYKAARVTYDVRNSTDISEILKSDVFSPKTKERLNAVSYEETRACVTNMQATIRALVDAAMNGVLETEGNWHYILSRFAVDYISTYIDKSFKTISLMNEADAIYAGKNVSIMPMLAAQCLYGIQTKQHGDYVFKTCLDCGDVFQFGRKSSEGDGRFRARPRGTDYCSKECQKHYSNHKVDENGKRLY